MRKNQSIKRIILLLYFLIVSQLLNSQYDIGHFFYRGRQCLMDGRYSQAIENFSVLVRLDNTLYEAYYFRGIAKYNLDDFIGAQLDFDKAIKINPVYTPAYRYRAIISSSIGDYDKAIKDLVIAVDLKPSYTGLYFNRGVAYYLSQQFEKAILDFNRFLIREPNVSDAYINRGASYLYLGDTIKAIQDYNKAISLNYFDPEGYIKRSRVYMLQDSVDLALKDLNRAIELDTTNTSAFFNRAIIRNSQNDFNGALADFNKVLNENPGNALTLYNRALIRTRIGDYNNALADYDRVIEINPNNVLAYFNRAGVFLDLHMYKYAKDDYSKSIELYPDFVKAYINRSQVKEYLGEHASAEIDSRIAQQKIREYRAKMSNPTSAANFADTTKLYNHLLSFDSDFARKDFNNDLLQYRVVDIRLKPLFSFRPNTEDNIDMAFEVKYESEKIDRFIASVPIPISIEDELDDEKRDKIDGYMLRLDELKAGNYAKGIYSFTQGILEAEDKQFNKALEHYNSALKANDKEAFYYINRGVLQAEMIDFISSIGSNVQSLKLDKDDISSRAREEIEKYDYTPAIQDLKKAAKLLPELPFIYYNLGNLYCLSMNLPESIQQYTKAIELYPALGEAYYNRGLVLVYLKDREKGCLNLSKAGELGVTDAYAVIKKYCER